MECVLCELSAIDLKNATQKKIAETWIVGQHCGAVVSNE